MAFWRRKHSSPPQVGASPEQAVLLYVPSLIGDDVGLDQVEDPVIAAVNAAGVGEFDGNMIGPEAAILYMYGPDADALWDAIHGAVRDAPIGPGSYAIKRYGGPGSDEVRVDLS